ncbi:hypothetical protein KPL78_19615 [Roseomonas sp. HJA6]|uniref:Cytochrome c domain-containing protein n=1 Tax=Roseomonas alba TaxID=2846776 RepID=A0ABS7ACP4_9PROT|nr:hypothetical protein [Neoroseomonas alba]MBW6400077.1 hypothetical protein [Neoroseomonas alba]
MRRPDPSPPPAFVPPHIAHPPARRRRILAAAGVLATAMAAAAIASRSTAPAEGQASPTPRVLASDPVAAGRYLVVLGDCNGCHTPRFAETNGAEPPESEWLTGSPIGFRGPWGVSYPSNLRLSAQATEEADWIAALRRRTGLPPMPWATLAVMNEDDLRAIYRYLRALGPRGEPAPAALGPGEAPETPVFDFVPVPPSRRAG